MFRLFFILMIGIMNIIIMNNNVSAKGLYIREEITNTLPGSNGRTVEKQMYFAGDMALFKDRTIPYDTLFNLKEKRVYLIDGANKQYSIIPIDSFKKLSEGAQGVLNDDQIVINETGRKKKIGKYNTFEVILTISQLGLKTETWLSGEFKCSFDLFYSFSTRTGFGAGTRKILELMRKHKAYSVESITTRSGFAGSVVFKLVEAVDREIPQNIFAIPAGFKEVKMAK